VRHRGEHDEFSIHARHGEFALDLQRAPSSPPPTSTSLTVAPVRVHPDRQPHRQNDDQEKGKQSSSVDQIQLGDPHRHCGHQDLQARWVHDHGAGTASTGTATPTARSAPASIILSGS